MLATMPARKLDLTKKRDPVPEEQELRERKLAVLRMASDAGDNSGIAEGDVFERVRRALKLSTLSS